MWEKKKHTGGNTDTISDRAAFGIVRLIAKAQEQFAKAMNKMFDRMSKKVLKITVIAFSFCFGCLSLFLALNAIVQPPKTMQHVKVDAVKIPYHFTKTGDEEVTTDAYVDQQTFQTITVFERYMDSLKIGNGRQYDSILQVRPKLMDSVRWLENLYYSQKQKAYEK